jgi:hypothetical protein
MTERGRRIIERDPNEVDRAMAHPAQRQAVGLIRDLLVELRATRSDKDRFEFQEELFRATFQAQTEQAEASRNLQRARRGRTTSSAPTGDWAVEQVVWDRIVRQLRTVGDAFAWRLFGFDRRYILALSENAPVSPLIGKAGLKYEIDEVRERWRRLGQFSLLHDLTSVIRIGDVTAFTPAGPQLVDDIKANPANRRSSQSRRAKQALRVLTEGAPLITTDGEEYELVLTRQQFKTHLAELGRGLEAADREVMFWAQIAHQLVTWTFSTTAPQRSNPGSPPTPADVLERSARRRTTVFSKAGLDQSRHHLRGERVDTHTRNAGLAPYTIYPFSPDVCARLTTDNLVFSTILAWERLEQAFTKLGYDTFCPLDDNAGRLGGPAQAVTGSLPGSPFQDPVDGRLDSDTPVIVVAKGNRKLTLHAWGLHQVQFELLDVDRFAAGVDEMWGRDLRGLWWGRRSGMLAFANERAVWR